MLNEATMGQIVRDISAGRPATGYSAEMLRFRREVEREFAAWKADHPSATLATPTTIDG